jgi:hypothetical protein
LDWGEEGCILRELTFDAIFTRGGVDLFRATTQAGTESLTPLAPWPFITTHHLILLTLLYAGFVGIFTGMRYADDQDGTSYNFGMLKSNMICRKIYNI